jgi:hypothetical protein
MSNVVAFKGNLPAINITHFQKALATTKNAVGVEAGNKQFLKLLKNGGYWVYGQKDTEVEEGSLWAINPMSLQAGFIAWKGGQPVGKRMGSIFNPPIRRDELDEVGAKWDEAVSFDLVCISGEDTGTECQYTANSYGGRKAFTDLMDALMKQTGVDATKIVPIVEMTSDSYIHKEFGETFNPIFEIKEWRAMDVAPAGEDAADDGDDNGEEQQDEQQPETPAEQPRRRAAEPPKQEAAAEPTRRRRAAPVTDVQPEESAKDAGPVRRQRRRAS